MAVTSWFGLFTQTHYAITGPGTATSISTAIGTSSGTGVFTITINENFIAALEAGTRYEGEEAVVNGEPYEWKSGMETTWIITPEDSGTLREEYNTWDGDKVEDTFFVYTLDTAEMMALEAVNNATTADELKAAIQDNAAKLGLATDSESEYGKLKTYFGDRQRSVSVDLLKNKPEESGYDLATLQEYFNAIVATRHVAQETMDHVNEAETAEDFGIEWVTNLQTRFEAAKDIYTYHSGEKLTAKAEELGNLINEYKALAGCKVKVGEQDVDAQQAVLTGILNARPEGGFGRSKATTEAFEAALIEVYGQVDTALTAVNNASADDNYAAVRTALEENAVVLGLDLTSYKELSPEGRKNAVADDIFKNKPKDGYDLATLQLYFAEIVTTRHATQTSLNMVKAAFSENGEGAVPLGDLKFIEILKDRFEELSGDADMYKYHTKAELETKVRILEAILDAFDGLDSGIQEQILGTFPNKKYTDSSATVIDIAAAINEKLGEDADEIDTTGYKELVPNAVEFE